MNEQSVNVCHDVNHALASGEINWGKKNEGGRKPGVFRDTPMVSSVLNGGGEARMKFRLLLLQIVVTQIALGLWS